MPGEQTFANVATILFIRAAKHPRLRGVAMQREREQTTNRDERWCTGEQFVSHFISGRGKVADSPPRTTTRIISITVEAE